jgi:hypothetical protein
MQDCAHYLFSNLVQAWACTWQQHAGMDLHMITAAVMCMWQQHMPLYSTRYISWGIMQQVQAVSTAGQRN